MVGIYEHCRLSADGSVCSSWCARSGFYSTADSPTVAELVCDSDNNLFQKVLNNQNHVLHKLLPVQSTHDYYFTPRSHDRSLCFKSGNNFLSRVLFQDTY